MKNYTEMFSGLIDGDYPEGLKIGESGEQAALRILNTKKAQLEALSVWARELKKISKIYEGDLLDNKYIDLCEAFNESCGCRIFAPPMFIREALGK